MGRLDVMVLIACGGERRLFSAALVRGANMGQSRRRWLRELFGVWLCGHVPKIGRVRLSSR